jgi:glycerol-3-phosphate dehydrogenase (NAD(P)+)
MGRFLGIGMNYLEAKTRYMPDETIEGAELLLEIGPTVEALVERGELDGKRLPLLRRMAAIVSGQAPPELPWDDFFKR